MLSNSEERKITYRDIERMITEMDEGWIELKDIVTSCLDITEDLLRISQDLESLRKPLQFT
ncbi:hypothetical protein [Paenibacillus alba]|uniref:Uncharacterized protein n=1 Tax=Paenibacillus alba TaxID=1197127 RepID=A0ABU6G0T1_9BACL|nr:hypothetical protein [Paenibacillus alba]MEC0227264.1 hypothetical protein [Paenibacillus alba]NQX67612.1 hypothetical protein [Paenibacillus alba]